jgi:glycosyltransferase involved in cell wall biosynthesis
MAEKLVSVVIPSYNRAYCIAKTIDSVLAQTHRNIEAIVVDDGSRDNTRELIETTYGDEPRVRYFHQKNGGVASARNRGLREVRGDYVALLDSDDLWLPWKIEAQLRCLDALPDAGMIWTDMTAVNPEGGVVAKRYLTKMYSAYGWFRSRDQLFERSFPFADLWPELAPEIEAPKVYYGDIFSEMVLGNLVHTSTVLLRRERAERVREFDVSLKRSGEDYDYHLRTCREGPVAYLDAVSILYMWGAADQLTAPKHRIDMARNFLNTISPVIAHDRDRIRLPKVMIDEVLAEAHAWLGECHYDLGEVDAARTQLFASLRHKPKQPRIAAYLALSLLPLGVGPRLHEAFRSAKTRLRPGGAANRAST